MSRRHRLFSEASYRFERGVDRELPLRASAKAVGRCSPRSAAARVVPGCTHARSRCRRSRSRMAATTRDRVAGQDATASDTVIARGCGTSAVRGDRTGTAARASRLTVIPPSWRPDLRPPQRPGRGGHPAGGVREHPGPDAAGRRRARADRPAADPQAGRPVAGRGRATSRCSASRSAPPPTSTGCSCRPTTRGGPALAAGQPAQRGRAAAAHHAAAGAAAGAGPQRRARVRRRRPVSRWGRCSARAPARRGSPRSCRWTGGRRPRRWPRWKRRLPAQPLRLGVVLAGDRELAGWWGAAGRPDGRTPSRPPARCCG